MVRSWGNREVAVVGFCCLLVSLLANMLYAEVGAVETPVNFVLGTQTFGVRYQFTQQTKLVETAEAIHTLGSDIFKGQLGEYTKQYSIPEDTQIKSFTDLLEREPSYQHVLSLPFRHYLWWVMTDEWRNGFTETEQQAEYKEMYSLCCFLQRKFDGSNKCFYLGHWEGDWWILNGSYDENDDPSDVAIEGMIRWYNTRQAAIDAANHDVPSTVRIYQYAEVNLVQKGMRGGKCLINDVIPHVNVDLVSYSSYDTIHKHRSTLHQGLREAMDYMESKLRPRAGIQGKRVFIGEYGFPIEGGMSAEMQARYAYEVCRAALEWGCPFALYWEMYCNEVRDGRHRGFWLIDDQNRRQPFYVLLQRYYTDAATFVDDFRRTKGRLPTDVEFRQESVRILDNAAKATLGDERLK